MSLYAWDTPPMTDIDREDLIAGGGSGTVGGTGVDNMVARWDGTANIQNSGVLLTDTNRMGRSTDTDSYIDFDSGADILNITVGGVQMLGLTEGAVSDVATLANTFAFTTTAGGGVFAFTPALPLTIQTTSNNVFRINSGTAEIQLDGGVVDIGSGSGSYTRAINPGDLGVNGEVEVLDRATYRAGVSVVGGYGGVGMELGITESTQPAVGILAFVNQEGTDPSQGIYFIGVAGHTSGIMDYMIGAEFNVTCSGAGGTTTEGIGGVFRAVLAGGDADDLYCGRFEIQTATGTVGNATGIAVYTPFVGFGAATWTGAAYGIRVQEFNTGEPPGGEFEVWLDGAGACFFRASTQWIGSSAANTLDVSSNTTTKFNIATGLEATLVADTLTFENGATDTGFGWGTTGQLDFRVGSTAEMRLTADNLTFENGASDCVLNWGTSGVLTLTGKLNANNGSVMVKAASADWGVPTVPSDALIDASFGAQATAGAGFLGVFTDSSAGGLPCLVFTNATSWYYVQGILAV